ncbi:MAG: hypothetical protein EU539_01405 [Promethearchaeota archaeon]|nr:MAG: hypothetical protein EU539_01405 [Candidatus Lokiarchaeota archaeon]
MSSDIFKVLFKGKTESDSSKLSLSFKSIANEKKINIPANLLLKLKEISDSIPNIISLHNISEVIKAGDNISPLSFNYYNIILYAHKDGSKKGFLIGNKKKSGALLIGTWPFNKDMIMTNELLVEILKNLIHNYEEYEQICFIS